MKLLFDEIGSKPRRVKVDDMDWFDSTVEQFSLLSSQADFSVRTEGRDTVLLEGKLSASRKSHCDRCGESFVQALQADFFYRLKRGQDSELEKGEKECSEEDIETLFLDSPVIDVDELLREQVYLSVPLQTLCRDNCKGVCSRCGALLNHAACSCENDDNRSPFAVLKQLSDRKDKH